jgi:hypothetical protein
MTDERKLLVSPRSMRMGFLEIHKRILIPSAERQRDLFENCTCYDAYLLASERKLLVSFIP